MKLRHLVRSGYLLLIVLLFAASCDDTQSTEPGGIDSTHVKDSLRIADSLHLVDSLRIIDSIRVNDSLRVVDSLRVIDSLSNLSAPAFCFQYVLIDTSGGTSVITSSPELTRATWDNGRLWLSAPDVLGFIGDYAGLMSYEMQGKAVTRVFRVKIGKDDRYTWGSVTITKFDLTGHKVSGRFDLVVLLGDQSADTVKVIGSFTEVDMLEQTQINASSVDYSWQSVLGLARYNIAQDRLVIATGARHDVQGCRTAGADEYTRFNMSISSPQVGLYVNGQAMWSDTTEVIQRDTRCSNSFDSYISRPSDTLMITSFDPAKRELSGWFNRGAGRGELKAVTWYESP